MVETSGTLTVCHRGVKSNIAFLFRTAVMYASFCDRLLVTCVTTAGFLKAAELRPV